MHSKGFVDTRLEVWHKFDQISSSNAIVLCSEMFVQLDVQFVLNRSVAGEVVQNSTCGTGEVMIVALERQLRRIARMAYLEVVSEPAISKVKASAVNSSFPIGLPSLSRPSWSLLRRSTRSVGVARRLATAMIAIPASVLTFS